MSIVDYLKSQGQDSSYFARKQLASQYGISGYVGSASQNTQLLDTLKGTYQKPQTPAPQQTQAYSMPTQTSQPQIQQPKSQVQNYVNQNSTIKVDDKVKDQLRTAIKNSSKEEVNKRLTDAGYTYQNGNLVKKQEEKIDVRQTKTLNDTEKQRLDSQLNDLGYTSDAQKQQYYSQNKIQFGSHPTAVNIHGSAQHPASYTPVQNLQEWNDRGKRPAELIDLVESRYGITAEYDSKTNTIAGYDQSGNKTMQWTFDQGGNPIREDIDIYTGENFMSDYQNLISGGASQEEIHSFLKKNITLAQENKDEVRNLYKGWLKQDAINQKVSKLSSLDGRGLYDAYLNGDFAKGDDVWNALPPEVQAQFDSFWESNIRTLAGKTDEEGNLVPIIANLESNNEEEIYNALAQHNPEFQKNFREIVLENTERKGLQQTLNDKYGAIEEKRMELKRIEEQIREKYPSASPSFIQAMINKQAGVLQDEIDELLVGYNTSLQEYNIIDADVQAEYGAYKEDAQLEFDVYQQAVGIKLERIATREAFANQKEIIELQAEQTRMTQAQTQAYQWKVLQFEADRQDKANEKAGQYMTNYKGEVMFVQEGKATAVIDSMGKVLATEKYSNAEQKVIENSIGGYDVVTTYEDGSVPTFSSYNNNGQLVSGVPKIVGDAMRSIPAEGKQCGEAVNDYLQNLGLTRLMGDSYASKTEDINSEVPAIGGLAIWNPSQWSGGKYAEYGHVGIITGISADGEMLEITHWNYKGDEKKSVDNIPRSEIESNGGYHVPAVPGEVDLPTSASGSSVIKDSDGDVVGTQADAKKWAENIKNGIFKMSDVPTGLENAVSGYMSADTGDGGLSVDAQNWVQLWNNGTMDIETIMTKIGASKEALPLKNEITKYINEQGGVAYRKANDPAVRGMQKLEQTVQDILDSGYKHTVSGTVRFSPLDTFTGGKKDILADLGFLIQGQTLQELIDAKANGATFGALSNEELRMLQQSSSILASSAIRSDDGTIKGFKMSESKFVAELEKMKTAFAGKVDRMTGGDSSYDPLKLGEDGYNSDNPLDLDF